MNIPTELKNIINDTLKNTNNSTVHQRASKQVQSYLQVLNHRIQTSKQDADDVNKRQQTVRVMQCLYNFKVSEEQRHTAPAHQSTPLPEL